MLLADELTLQAYALAQKGIAGIEVRKASLMIEDKLEHEECAFALALAIDRIDMLEIALSESKQRK